MAKNKTLTVTHPINGDLVLEESHALRLLAMPNNGGWKLKEEPKQIDGHGDHTEKARKPKKSD